MDYLHTTRSSLGILVGHRVFLYAGDLLGIAFVQQHVEQEVTSQQLQQKRDPLTSYHSNRLTNCAHYHLSPKLNKRPVPKPLVTNENSKVSIPVFQAPKK